MRKTLVGLLMLSMSVFAQAQDAVFKDGHPDRYEVVKGDTLWDIAGRFLNLPWKWPEIWHANPQIANPHLIYPGDIISLVYIDGQPRLTVNRGQGGTIRLSPTVRSTPIAEAIPTIPLEAINAFLRAGRIFESPAELEGAPYVIGGQAESVIAGAGNRVYARGEVTEDQKVFAVYRRGKSYTDPATGEFLGLHADEIGQATVVAQERDIATLMINRSSEEVRIGDRLLETEERAVNSNFFPSDPETEIDGVILDVPRGVKQVGQFDVVLINKGRRDGLSEGSVLAIHKAGEVVRDRVSNEIVTLPEERAGLLMVFRPYERMSYGIVLNATSQMAAMDRVRNP